MSSYVLLQSKGNPNLEMLIQYAGTLLMHI